MNKTLQFKLNGQPQSLTADSNRMLLWALRTDLGLTGCKYGCGEGYCGACSVLIDNQAIRSCQLPLEDIQGKEVMTIEGLSENGNLHPIQKAFAKHNALQCGFCTPGMILNAYSLLIKNPDPNRQDIIDSMEDNFCRCGNYKRIIEAIQTAAQKMKGGKLR